MPESAESGKTKVNVGYPYDVFNHGVKGVPALDRSKDPVEVSAADLKKLQAAADNSKPRVFLTIGDENDNVGDES